MEYVEDISYKLSLQTPQDIPEICFELISTNICNEHLHINQIFSKLVKTNQSITVITPMHKLIVNFGKIHDIFK